MFILAQTYWNEITAILNRMGKDKNDFTDDQIFKMVAESIEFPIEFGRLNIIYYISNL